MSRLSMMMVLLALAAPAAAANMADQAHQSKVAGIDLITYHSNVKDVVIILGVLPAGDAMAGSGNIAIPTLSGMMLDRGTKSLDQFSIAEKLDNVGAEISFAVGMQSLELRTPALQTAEFNKAKEQFIGELQSSLQNSSALASESFGRAVFPEGHPNHPHTLKEYIAAAKAANLDELKAFQAKYYGPAHMTLVVVGDVADAETQADISKAFSGWTGGQDYLRASKPAAPAAANEITIPLADKPSVNVLLGQASGLRYGDPDGLALHVGTAILGRGFTGRLMSTVRDKEGLTYNIGASVGDDSIVDGVWEVSASFAPTLLSKGVESTRREVSKWWKDGVTEQELAARKQGEIGSYFVSLSTTLGLAETLLVNAQRGYDPSWLDGYPKALKALTRDQVNAAIKAHINPATMVLVEAGTVPAAAK
jgi:zinc protease